MQDAQPVVLTGEALLSAFHTLSAEADLLLLKGYFHASITIYTKALALVPDDKHCLVSRAKCYIQSGSPALALQDSNTVIEIYPDFFKGVFWKAEALYAQGDFEQSLVYYHRGSSIKPEFPEFRIGIQKATEAIENSIGDPNVRIRVNEDSRRYWVPQCIDSEFKKPVGEFHHATLQRAVTENKPANTQNKKVNQSGMVMPHSYSRLLRWKSCYLEICIVIRNT